MPYGQRAFYMYYINKLFCICANYNKTQWRPSGDRVATEWLPRGYRVASVWLFLGLKNQRHNYISLNMCSSQLPLLKDISISKPILLIFLLKDLLKEL